MRSVRHQALLLLASVALAAGIGAAAYTVHSLVASPTAVPLFSISREMCCPNPGGAPGTTPAPGQSHRLTLAPRPASLQFSGPLSGTVDGDVATCETGISEGTPPRVGAWMTMPATIAGVEYTVVLYSDGPAPGTVTGIEVDQGTSVGSHDLYALLNPAGVSGFDWASGATLDVDVPVAFHGAGAPLHLRGSIACWVDTTP